MFDENRIFRETTIRICGSLDIQTALQNTFEFLRTVLPIDQLALAVFNPDLLEIRRFAVAEMPQKRVLIPELMPMRYSPEIREMVQSEMKSLTMQGKSDVVIHGDNYSDIPLAREMLMATLGRTDVSVLVLRLVLGTEYIGSVIFFSDHSNAYTREHADLVNILAEPFAVALTNALRYEELNRLKDRLIEDNPELHRDLRRFSGDTVIGSDSGLREVMEMVAQIARLSNPVLLLGETGVGKEVIANAIHESSSRADGPIIRVNCGAIPENLVESELFGYEKGAFTGAVGMKRGYFERAHKGTIFLDEIAELPLPAQVKLLRVLQSMEFERVGGVQTIRTDVRVVTATHRDLEAMCREGSFREDLWYRLSVFPMRIPPLRERVEDIPALARYFIDRKAREMNLRSIPDCPPEEMRKLAEYAWPGNVRELQNIVERALILSRGRPLVFSTLGRITEAARAPSPAEESTLSGLDKAMAAHIKKILAETHGRIEGPFGAAAKLGLHPSTLRHRMRKLKIPFGRKR